MNRTVRMIAAFLAVAGSAIGVASADSPKFHPAPGAMPVIGRYVVTLADSVAGDLIESSVKGMAMSYGGQLEPQPSSNVRQFVISMAPSRARTLSADPRVRDVVEIPQSDEAGSAAPSAPSHADLSRHGLVPVAQDSSSSGTYLYDGAGNIKAIGSDTFVYDVVGRLKQATVQGSQQNYDYDAFGNRILTTRASNAASCVGGCEAPSTVFGQSNHLTGATYDVAGNVLSVNGAAYSYDGSGMVTRATVGSDDRMFIYTADDERIGVRNGVSWTWTVRDLSGKVLRELTSLETQASPLVLSYNTWSKDYVWRDGLLLASVFPITPGTISPTTTYHYHLDHLGTPRMITGNDGVLVARHTYYPFGAEMDITPHESAIEAMKFTGHERDVVAANNAIVDYMHARYYNAAVGRFLSVDPSLDLEKAVQEPQLWNRYSYVGNNPTSFTDPNGKERLPCAAFAQTGRCGSVPWRGAAREVGEQLTVASMLGMPMPGEGLIGRFLGSVGRMLGIGADAGIAGAIGVALESANSAVRLEGEAAAALGESVTGFQKVVSSGGRVVGEIDVETTKAIVEVTGGRAPGKVNQVAKLLTDKALNPQGKPVVVYGPNLGKQAAEALQKA